MVLTGIGYSPVPLKRPGDQIPDDDFMANGSWAFWGHNGGRFGRGDLSIMRDMGANAVRLYGNDPALDHGAFMDEAQRQNLKVIVGLSDYPFIQMQGSCFQTGWNCYSQIRKQFANDLRSGFLTHSGTYHPAIRTLIVMNEPDLKFEIGTIQGLPGVPAHFCRALVTAIDAVLDAEREANISGPLPNLSVAFSFGRCNLCSRFQTSPALGQMWELRRAMQRPERVGYKARNDLWAAYQQRFENAFNTANSALEIKPLFLDDYDWHFQGTPVFIGEYHSPYYFDQEVDLEEILEVASNRSSLLSGICFFEFQVRYDKGGAEMNFGMFGLSDSKEAGHAVIAGQNYTSWCLTPRREVRRSQCGQMESDVNYESSDEWSLNISHVWSAELCCARCHQHKSCSVWTWERDAGLDGCPSSCHLKGGRPARKVRQTGFVSGLPMPHRSLISASQRKRQDAHKVRQEAAWVHTAVEQAFGGHGVDLAKLCPSWARSEASPRIPTLAPVSLQ